MPAPDAAPSGPTAAYPAALHPESSAHTKRLVDAAVADAVAVSQREWEHERGRLMSSLADRDRQVFRLARAVAQVAQQGADRKRQEAARLLVGEVQRLQTRERRLLDSLAEQGRAVDDRFSGGTELGEPGHGRGGPAPHMAHGVDPHDAAAYGRETGHSHGPGQGHGHMHGHGFHK